MDDEKEKPRLVLPTPGEISRLGSVPRPLKVRSELEVLPADTERKPLGFMVEEFCGSLVVKEAGFFKWLEVKDDIPKDYWLTNREDLSQGDIVYCESLFGWMKMIVKPMEGGGYILDTDPEKPDEGTLGFIKFDADSRRCWVCWGHANKKIMAMCKKTSPEP